MTSERSSEEYVKKQFGGMDMLLCTGITAACSVLSYEGLFPRKAMLPIRIAALVLLAFNWFFSAYTSGKHGRTLFLLFSIIYWIAPTAGYIACDFSVSEGKGILLVKSICSLLTVSPFTFAAELTGLPEWFFSALTLIISAAVYKFTYSLFYVRENRNRL